eukprot:5743850-Alexandrium_andersonii.AAC.2
MLQGRPLDGSNSGVHAPAAPSWWAASADEGPRCVCAASPHNSTLSARQATHDGMVGEDCDGASAQHVSKPPAQREASHGGNVGDCCDAHGTVLEQEVSE